MFTRYALLDLYRQATATRQDWGFFAPNPPRINEFMRVVLEDRNRNITDVRHDVYGRRTYPYLWYDRRGKVNRRLSQEIAYQADYAAWVCRAWESTHGGEPAVEVRFVRLMTRIPPPATAYVTGGYDPRTLPVYEMEAGRYRCVDLPDGQLPPNLRRRFGLPGAPDGSVKKVELETWWNRRAAPAEPPHDNRGIE